MQKFTLGGEKCAVSRCWSVLFDGLCFSGCYILNLNSVEWWCGPTVVYIAAFEKHRCVLYLEETSGESTSKCCLRPFSDGIFLSLRMYFLLLLLGNVCIVGRSKSGAEIARYEVRMKLYCFLLKIWLTSLHFLFVNNFFWEKLRIFCISIWIFWTNLSSAKDLSCWVQTVMRTWKGKNLKITYFQIFSWKIFD